MSGPIFTHTILAFRLTPSWNLFWSELLGSAVSHICSFPSLHLRSTSQYHHMELTTIRHPWDAPDSHFFWLMQYLFFLLTLSGPTSPWNSKYWKVLGLRLGLSFFSNNHFTLCAKHAKI